MTFYIFCTQASEWKLDSCSFKGVKHFPLVSCNPGHFILTFLFILGVSCAEEKAREGLSLSKFSDLLLFLALKI